MGTIKRFYERAAESLFLVDDATEADLAIVNAAGGIDRLLRQLAEDSRDLAKRFSDYAIALDTGERGWSSTPPTRYSTVNDVHVNAVRLDEARDALKTLISVTKGADALKAFRAEVARLYELSNLEAGRT